MSYKLSQNNFDLIRLFAASEVAVLHVFSYLSNDIYAHPAPAWNAIIRLLEMFPGVPTFFFISGFLISRSYERVGSVREYGRNRALRIFPALWVCVAVNLLMVWGTGYFAIHNVSVSQVLLLYVAKTTFFQFYNPDYMRHFGDGVLNGSLWTVCVELQFYFLIPLLYKLLPSGKRRASNFVLVALIVLSIVCNRLLYANQHDMGSSIVWKLARVSFLPWFYMFLTGVLVQKNFDTVMAWLPRRPFLYFLPAYIAYATLMLHLGFTFHNEISPLLYFPLAAVVLASAYTAPTLARRLLRGNDFSYGIYIYHVPFMNMFLYYGWVSHVIYTGMVLALTAVTAAVSWFAVERPSLRQKHRSIHPVAVAP
jgi:peptidoglycan/LPS O-acetylase OafA/YrhL